MNGETMEYYDDESFDDESFDDESFDDETAEFLPGIGSILPGIVSTVGGAIGNILSPKRPPAPLPSVRLPASGPGVTSAQLNTPAGSATLALPSALVRQEEFRAAIGPLKEGLDRNTARLNSATGELTKLRNDFVKVETDTRSQVAKLRADARKALIKARKDQAAAYAKMKKEQSSQQMMNMVMTMMMQQQIQDQLDSHTHTIPDHIHDVGGTDSETATPAITANAMAPTGSSDNSFMMMLPMMMMQDGGSGSDNMMLPMMMMFAFR